MDACSKFDCLPKEILQIIVQKVIGPITTDELDTAPFPAMLLVLDSVSQSFHHALSNTRSPMYNILSNFRQMSFSGKKSVCRFMMRSASRAFGSILLRKWLSKHLHYPIFAECYYGAIEGKNDL